MKRILPILLVLLLLTGCSTTTKAEYTQIDQDTAKTMMTADDGHVIVADVRRQVCINMMPVPKGGSSFRPHASSNLH